MTNDKLMQEIQNLLNEMLVINRMTQLMNIKYFAKYDKNIGFKFCIDGFHNLPKKSLFVCVYSVYPDNDIYQNKFNPQFVKINFLYDWNSPLQSP